MDWIQNAHDWPMAAHSQFILHKPHLWHVQIAGSGPTLLLIHGAGGATQSWRHLFPRLAKNFTVIAVDLPAQGFTKCGAQGRCGLSDMTQDITSLVRTQGWEPAGIIGHSAGAAIALQLARELDPSVKVIGINAALTTFKGMAGLIFPMMAKTLVSLPMVADVFVASSARSGGIRKLLDGTGSRLMPNDMIFYERLFRDRQHVNGTLQMMAQWNLDPLKSSLRSLPNPVHLIADKADKMVPNDTSLQASRVLPNGFYTLTDTYGHLMHEVAPDIIADLITSTLGARPTLQ